MILKYHFEDGTAANVIPDKWDSKGFPMVMYKGNVFSLVSDTLQMEVFIDLGEKLLFAEGSIDLIAGREVMLYWRYGSEHNAAELDAECILKDHPNCETLAFGAHHAVAFTLETEGFVTQLDDGQKVVKQTIGEMRDYLDSFF
ncbi:hypothetical protein SAMN05216311_120113 [Chitinophaga sp. CF418]|nr:hypothetical protein SAMN05216311_120113 [Chitinophaga sp. CF418]